MHIPIDPGVCLLQLQRALNTIRSLRLLLWSMALLLPQVSAHSCGAQLLGSRTLPGPVVIPTLQPPAPGFQFPQHLTLTYAVDWRVFQAGIATFQLDQQPPPAALPGAPANGPQLKIGATADTIGATTMLFPVIDKFQAGFDTRSGCSTGFSKQLLEGRRKVASDLTFDYTHGRQNQTERNLVKGTQKQLTAAIPACVTDSLSAIFYAASQPLVVGQKFGFPLADAMRTVTVTMKVEAREEVKTPAGTFQTLRVQPTAEEGVVRNRGTIRIWYTDDPRHMPVMIQANLFWGTIIFRLQSFEGR